MKERKQFSSRTTSIEGGETRLISGDSPDLLNKLIFREGGFEKLDLVALLGEDIAAGLVDILKQQHLDILGGKGLQMLRIGQRNDPIRECRASMARRGRLKRCRWRRRKVEILLRVNVPGN